VVGKKIGNRYEILCLIGGGGMSLVYQARDIYLNRIVAVKVLREQFTSDNEFVRRFRREAQAVASLSHPNIVSIYDVGQDENIYYLVMEYIKGKTLKEIIQEEGPLPLDKAVDFAKQICDALEHAHEKAIVHRDIKPHNILITRGGRVKVTDFGIARAVSTATVTHTGGIIGSVHYFSPEQAKGEVTGEKSDIYSLGIVIYEMVTGKLPFEGESPISVALKHIQKEPIPPTKYNSGIPVSLERIILKAISKDPQDRYENVHKLRLDLMAALLDKVVSSSTGYLDTSLKNNFDGRAVSEDTLIFEEKNVLETENKNIKKSKPKTRKIKPVGFVVIAIISLLLIVGLFWGTGKIFIKQEISVPNVVNLPTTQAERILTAKGLKMVVSKEIPHSEIPEGRVLSQDPLADTTTKSGRVIKVTVSSGPALVSVPDVIGRSQIIADVNITNAGLVVGEISFMYSLEYPQSLVINQSPKANELVPEKSTVDLVISKGPEPQYISMPSLIGLDLNTVEARLQEAGLSSGEVKKQKSKLFPKDFVIEQNPIAGKEVFQGTSVNLVVSEGPGPTTQQARVKIVLNESGEVKIEVRDVKGTRIAYQKYHEQGDIFTKMVNYFGQAVITVYIDGKKFRQQVVPAEQ